MGKLTMLELAMKAGAEGAEMIYPVLLKGTESLVLVDCAFVGALPLLEEAIVAKGFSPQNITHIVITHQDHDHMGSAAAFKRKYPAVKIVSSKLEEPYISGKIKSLRLAQAEVLQETLPPEKQAFGEMFCRVLRSVEPVAVDITVEDGQQPGWLDGCAVVATPGHTPGHLSLYLPRERTVITGDAMTVHNGKPAVANPQFALDPDEAKASLRKLLALEAETYICHHGGIYHKPNDPRQ